MAVHDGHRALKSWTASESSPSVSVGSRASDIYGTILAVLLGIRPWFRFRERIVATMATRAGAA